MTVRKLVAIGVGVFVVTLLVSFPARIASHWFLPAAVQLNGVDGTIWRGTASEGAVAGIYLHDVKWSLKPWQVFLGRLGAAVDTKLASGFIEGNVAAGATGTVTLKDVNAAVPLAAFAKVVQMNGATGQLTLQLQSAQLTDGWPTDLTGRVAVANLLIRNLSANPVGSYTAEFQADDTGITGSVEDSGGILDLAGTIHLTPERAYSFIGKVGPTPDAPPSVTDQLRYLGTADARGLRNFRIEGSL